MAEGIEIYTNVEGDKVILYKIYSRVDVQYKAQFMLSDKFGNSIKRIFSWQDIAGTWGRKKLTTAFLGKGLKPLESEDIDLIYTAFLNAQNKIETMTVGKSSSTTLLTMKHQLKEWYDESLNENGLKRMIVTLEDGSQYDVIYDAILEEDGSIKLKDGSMIDKENRVYDKDHNVKDNLTGLLIKAGEIKDEPVLLISCNSFKKWLIYAGYQPNPFLKKLVQAGLLYAPNALSNPRYHTTGSDEWYRAIYIDKLYLIDLIV